ncbi:UDP-N-acetyl glucosamine 2-epimerase [Adlercreutzia sp. ZJ304]|uniref:UDP-N-acetyl glucosamine 2-epimerase n=1 Tax=Adlercreutzia sp. ZJ304 TaxID=2709791 RepID=UPI0013ED3675|nr:UDP-N-acetyl glucosamine 2-epimerase [Adlercreutzia sp. ZJ304]
MSEFVCSCIDEPTIISGRSGIIGAMNPFEMLARRRSWKGSLLQSGLDEPLVDYFCCCLANAFCLIHYITTHSGLFNGIDCYVSIFDQYPEEYIFVCECRRRGIKTVVLQHGAQSYSKNSNDDLLSYSFALDHLNSDYLFAWNQLAKCHALSFGVPEEKILVVGDPFIEKREFPLLKVREPKRFCVVLEAGKDNIRDLNAALLDFADSLVERYSLEGTVRFHPTNYDEILVEKVRNSGYLKIGESETISRLSGDIDFAIAARSSVYAELLLNGVPVFRYVPDADYDPYEGLVAGVFSNLVQLAELFSHLMNGDECLIEGLKRNIRALFVSGGASRNYRQAFEAVLRSPR